MGRLDKKTWKVIEERYKQGESVYSLAKEYNISHSAIVKHMQKYGISRESDTEKTDSDIDDIPEEMEVTHTEAREIKTAVKDKLSELDREMAEIDQIRNRIYDQVGGAYDTINPMAGTGDIQGLLWELERRKKEYERMKKKLMEMVGRTETTGTLDAKGIVSLKEQLNQTVNEAKAVLEEMGYKVVPKDTPTNLEEAKKLLADAGYEVKNTLYTKEDLEKEIERIKRELEEKYKKEADKQAQSVRVDGAVKVVEMVVDRLFGLFEPYVKPKVTETVDRAADKKEEVRKVISLLRDKSKEMTGGE